MGRFARVTSIDVLQTTAGALQKYRGESTSAIEDLDAVIRRTLEWIQHERKDFWAQELRRSTERVSEARLQLQQARASRRLEGHEPACVDEQRAVQIAERRVEAAKEKVYAVQHWTRAIEQAIEDIQRPRSQFLSWLENDLEQAVAALNRMSESLALYVASTQPPTLEEKPSGGEAKTTDEEKGGES